MRSFRFVAALLLSATPAFAQVAPTATAPSVPTDTTHVTHVTGVADTYRLRFQLWLLRSFGAVSNLPDMQQFSIHNRVVPAGVVVSGPVGVMDGSLDVFGTITGMAIVFDGNLRIHPGAQINGDALAVGGRVINQGGSVSGEARSLSTLSFTENQASTEPAHTTMWALKLTLAWFAVLVIIGVGVMIFAESNLDGVVVALERGIGRAFLAGVVGQVAAMPLLALLCIALALTIIGVLLIPFAIVAYFIAIAGLLTLGFLAIARISGLPAVRSAQITPRGVNLRAMFIGLIAYFGLWAVAAAFTGTPVIGDALRVIAFMITWVAATAGLGATLLSRAGTKRPRRSKDRAPSDDLSWQTPTPVSGVAASRRR